MVYPSEQSAVSCDSSACKVCQFDQHNSYDAGFTPSSSPDSTQIFAAHLYARHTARIDSSASSDGVAPENSRRSLSVGVNCNVSRGGGSLRKRQRSLTFEDLARASLRSRLLPTADSGSCSQLVDLMSPSSESQNSRLSSMSGGEDLLSETDGNFLQRLSVSSVTSCETSYPADMPSFVAMASFPRQVDSPAAATPQCQSDIMCGMDFSPDGWFFASCGVRKQVRVYSLADALAAGGSAPGPVWSHRMAAKLSCLVWSPHPGASPCAYVADYDGEVTQMDLSTGHLLSSVDGHRGRRVWAIAQSSAVPHLVASASDDGTVALWTGSGLCTRAATLMPAGRQSVTSVDFCSGDEHALLTSASDGNAYVYDLRYSNEPVTRLRWHNGAVSHARFCGRNTAVTSATDGAIACWDLSASNSTHLSANCDLAISGKSQGGSTAGDGESSDGSCTRDLLQPSSVYRGHVHCHNFVGLSVRSDSATARGGAPSPSERSRHLIASGSEDGRAVVYNGGEPRQAASWWLREARKHGESGENIIAPLSGACMRVPGADSPESNSGGTNIGRVGKVPTMLKIPQCHAQDSPPSEKLCHEFLSRSSEFVSAVAWAPLACTASEAPLLAVASSNGHATVIQLQQ